MIRNSAKITFANKTLCFKVFIFRAIVYAICFTICYFLAKATIFPILQSEEVSAVFDTLRGIVGNFFTANPNAYDTIINTVNIELEQEVKAVIALINSKMSGIVWSVVGVIVVSLVLTFLLGVFDYTVGVLVNDHMSTLQHAGFLSTMFEYFANACQYGLYRLIALLLYNGVMYTIVLALGVLLLYFIDFFALPIIVFLMILVVVLRQTFAGQTLPNMVCGKMSVFNAFIENFKNNNNHDVTERFMSYLILSILMFSITVLGGVSTFYVALILIVPFNAVIYSTIKFVDYYNRNGKKYYVTFDYIVIPKELRDNDEQLLNKVDIF